ncbi:hypothetical protein METBIDRAFT_182790 [Metschnikowia bicuspidata var. bicuspidata NRRL YB-4993]|uniref:Secreted protein n=1 Tax=Metschnikowia bicuspidata var. bicuspidata NRRL YB-4993 TaxID=869754 RepID=A0A1A0HBY2_9ASCO|nr:hypothetical protein METBIDRAFT_182790 [Metschnikowia bicuspidata var. bicuspidata NRRL YB-4993]OBA21398.1 hypothetical protein METBIDRAFT_182790 [Metschnikowia bicuspidata var. bicuspidata NRRL YB-4993]
MNSPSVKIPILLIPPSIALWLHRISTLPAILYFVAAQRNVIICDVNDQESLGNRNIPCYSLPQTNEDTTYIRYEFSWRSRCLTTGKEAIKWKYICQT